MKEEEKDQVIKELLNSMGDEYLKGATAMLNSITEKVCIRGGCRNCIVCNNGLEFLNQERKKIEKLNVLELIERTNGMIQLNPEINEI